MRVETQRRVNSLECGRPGWTRTSDPQLRRLMLYPPELRAHICFQRHAADRFSLNSK